MGTIRVHTYVCRHQVESVSLSATVAHRNPRHYRVAAELTVGVPDGQNFRKTLLPCMNQRCEWMLYVGYGLLGFLSSEMRQFSETVDLEALGRRLLDYGPTTKELFTSISTPCGR